MYFNLGVSLPWPIVVVSFVALLLLCFLSLLPSLSSSLLDLLPRSRRIDP